MADQFKNLVDMFDKSVKKFGPQELFGTKRNDAWEWSTFEQIGTMVANLRGGLAYWSGCGLPLVTGKG